MSSNKNRETETLYLAQSTIEGTGLYAKQNFKKGDVIDVLTGTKYRKLNKDVHDVLGNERWIKLDRKLVVDPAFPFSHINHCCEANAGILDKGIFVAIKSIKKGEEVTFDYAIQEDDARWFMKCTCGAKNCRGYVRSVHFIPLKQFRKYEAFMPSYFRDVYKSYFCIT